MVIQFGLQKAKRGFKVSDMSQYLTMALCRLYLSRGLSLKEKRQIFSDLGPEKLPGSAWWENLPLAEEITLPKEKELTDILAFLEEKKVITIYYGHAEYPKSLYELTNPPLLLFARGNIKRLLGPLCAIVGTRSPGERACRWTKETAQNLADYNIGIISGGASGIDSAALQGGLLGSLPPVVVLGVPAGTFYPKSEEALQQQIIAAGGLVISEYAPGTTVRRDMFLARNRLIAALSGGVLVSSAGIPSGALSTAAFAQKLGRVLMTLPLSPWEKASAGNNLLLRRGAKSVTSAKEIAADFNSTLPLKGKNLNLPFAEKAAAPKKPAPAANLGELPPPEEKIFKYICAAPRLLEELLAYSGHSHGELATMLLELELGGYITKDSAGYFSAA